MYVHPSDPSVFFSRTKGLACETSSQPIFLKIICDVDSSLMFFHSLPARASEQGNVIGSVRIYIFIYMCVQFFFVIERTRDLIYLKFVATDFFPKIISPSAGENFR